MKYLKEFQDIDAFKVGGNKVATPCVCLTNDDDGNILSYRKDGDSEFVNYQNGEKVTVEMFNEKAFVDLGLSVKWLKYNLGATSETDTGDFFQWASVVGYRGDEAKAHSTWSTSPRGEYQNSNMVDSEDAIRVSFGNDFRLPTATEMQELLTLTNEAVVNYHNTGVNGMILHGKDSGAGNELFIPYTCMYYGGVNIGQTRVYLWSRNRATNLNMATSMQTYGGDTRESYIKVCEMYYKCYAMPLRGVYIG